VGTKRAEVLGRNPPHRGEGFRHKNRSVVEEVGAPEMVVKEKTWKLQLTEGEKSKTITRTGPGEEKNAGAKQRVNANRVPAGRRGQTGLLGEGEDGKTEEWGGLGGIGCKTWESHVNPSARRGITTNEEVRCNTRRSKKTL